MSAPPRQERRNEWSPCAGWNAEGRIRAGVGWTARSLERQWTIFWRMGALSPEGFARRSESNLRVAGLGLVRAADSAIERRRQDLGSRRQQVRVRRRDGHASVVRRNAATV